jgi:hypothetical protein
MGGYCHDHAPSFSESLMDRIRPKVHVWRRVGQDHAVAFGFGRLPGPRLRLGR